MWLCIATAIVLCVVVLYLVVFPPGPVHSECTGPTGGLFSVLLKNYVGALIHQGEGSVYVRVRDPANHFTLPGKHLSETYLQSEPPRPPFTLWHRLHSYFVCKYSYYLWRRAKEQTHFPMHSSTSLQRMHELVAKNLAFKDHIVARADQWWHAHGLHKASHVIGVHYRGGDTVHHYPFVQPEPAWFGTELAHVRKPGSVVVCVTIDPAFRTWSTAQGLPLLWSSSEQVDVGTAYNSWKEDNQCPVERGTQVIVDCLILARCHYLIKNRSCISDMALILNPDMGCSFIFTDREVYRKPAGAASQWQRVKE